MFAREKLGLKNCPTRREAIAHELAVDNLPSYYGLPKTHRRGVFGADARCVCKSVLFAPARRHKTTRAAFYRTNSIGPCVERNYCGAVLSAFCSCTRCSASQAVSSTRSFAAKATAGVPSTLAAARFIIHVCQVCLLGPAFGSAALWRVWFLAREILALKIENEDTSRA